MAFARVLPVKVPTPELQAGSEQDPSEPLVIVAGGVRVGVRPGFDRATLRAVLEIVQEWEARR